MTRALLLALALLAFAIPTTHAQPATEICDNRFERYLKGHFIEDGELMPFIGDDVALESCRSALDLRRREHALIEAWIAHRRRVPDNVTAARLYHEHCAQGSALACAYAAQWRADSDRSAREPADILPQLLPLTGKGLPVADMMAGLLLATMGMGKGGDTGPGRRLLERASDAGDYAATIHLFFFTMIDPARPAEDFAPLQALTEKAIAQGHVPSMRSWAQYQVQRRNDHDAAFALTMRAATADPRWFQPYIADAQYELWRLLKDGIGTAPDPAAAQRWLQSSAALGNPHARDELQKK